jgi:hypothetical protein
MSSEGGFGKLGDPRFASKAAMPTVGDLNASNDEEDAQ